MKINEIKVVIDVDDLRSLDGYTHLQSGYKIVSTKVVDETSIEVVLKDTLSKG